MAQGDITVFNQFIEDMGTKIHDLNGDTIKLGLVTSTVTPTAATSDGRWGAGGSTNFSTNEVTPGGNYATGGADVVNTYSQTSGTGTFDASDTAMDITSDPSNPTNVRWGIFYNDTSAGKEAIAFLDFGADTDLTAGDLDITVNASGLFTIA